MAVVTLKRLFTIYTLYVHSKYWGAETDANQIACRVRLIKDFGQDNDKSVQFLKIDNFI